jgi:hypothetical protein
MNTYYLSIVRKSLGSNVNSLSKFISDFEAQRDSENTYKFLSPLELLPLVNALSYLKADFDFLLIDGSDDDEREPLKQFLTDERYSRILLRSGEKDRERWSHFLGNVEYSLLNQELRLQKKVQGSDKTLLEYPEAPPTERYL